MPRLFTGIEIPRPVAERLSFLRGGLVGARWIDADRYHVTLRFIGDVDMITAEAAAESLARVRRRAFSLRVRGLTALGTRKPHAVVAEIEPAAPLMDLQAEHERLMQRIGLPAEEFVAVHTRPAQLAQCGLDPESIARTLREALRLAQPSLSPAPKVVPVGK